MDTLALAMQFPSLGPAKDFHLLDSRPVGAQRVQRTIVLNTAHARGFAVGFLRTAPPESRKTIEQDVLKNFNEQKEFFFNLFPEQREGETKEARA
jgi:hypothetical protein